MHAMVEKIFKTFGASYVLAHDDGIHYSLRAFLQPRKALSQRNAIKRISPLGEILGDTYLLICLPDSDMRVGDTLEGPDGEYEIRQVETVYYKYDPLYRWGLCVQKGGADTWDLQS